MLVLIVNFSSMLFDISSILLFSFCVSAFFHMYILRVAGFCLDIAMLESTKTISWSLMPGIASHLLINDGRFVKNTSSRFWPLVGKLTDCIRPKSSSSARKISLISLRYWLLVIVFEDQLISGLLFKTKLYTMYHIILIALNYKQRRSCIYAVTPWRAHRQVKKKGNKIK